MRFVPTSEIALRLRLTIEATLFAEELGREVATGCLTVVDAIERILGEHLANSVSKALGDRLIKAPRTVVHPYYFKNRCENLANLGKKGYTTWYPVVRFATSNDDTLTITQLQTAGFDAHHINYGRGVRRRYTYQKRDLKSQVNHTVRLNEVTIPSEVFATAILVVGQQDAIKQPYIANLTVGSNGNRDDRIEGFRVVSFDHVVTGERRFCRCHSDVHSHMLADAREWERSSRDHVRHSWFCRVINLLDHAIYVDDICHFCVGRQHGDTAHFDWYGNQVHKYNEPYVDLLVRSAGMDRRTATAEAKRRLAIGDCHRPTRIEKIPPAPAVSPSCQRRTREKTTCADLGIDQPSALNPRWVPIGESATIAGWNIGGMVYVGSEPLAGLRQEPDNAFIDPSKPVAGRADDLQAIGMPYWPNYSSIHPRSRATYLAWLAGGRSDPDYNVSYVFLYFYGLERRFFVDHPNREERRAIIVEVERLLAVYGSNRSVHAYLQSFLQAARIVVADHREPVPEYERSGYELPISVRLAIGRMLQNGKPVPAVWMLSWLMTHPDRRLRTPSRRAFPEFRALFEIRFNERFPNGFRIVKPRSVLSYSYRAASSNFEKNLTNLAGEIPGITRLSKPLDTAAQIAEEVTEELDGLSRYLGRNPDGRGSIEAHALLPEPLHALFPCPELDKLKAWAQKRMAQGGLVPVADLIERLEGTTPEKIGRRRLIGAADALARLSIGMAPDPRFALRSPKLGEPVVLFPLPDDITRLDYVSEDYAPALLSLVMGAFIAQADGTVSASEKRHLTGRFESSKVLSSSEKARLRANLDWMLAVPPDLGPISRRLKAVGEELRHVLGRLALAVVGADGVVNPAEVKAIDKLYRIMNIETEDIYRELHALAATPEPVTVFRPTGSDTEYAIPAQPEETAAPDERAPIELDQERVAAILADTTHVSNVLHAVFSDDPNDAQDDREEVETTAGQSERFAGLDAKHRVLVEELMRQPSWTSPAFEKLARQFGLMPSGALETINEWAFERFGIGLIEEDGDFEVNTDLLDGSGA